MGTIINTLAVIIGSFFGLIIKNKLPDKIIKTVFQAIGLFTLFIGAKMSMAGTEILFIVFSLILGAILGEFLDLEEKMKMLSDKVQKKVMKKQSNSKFTEGLLTAFMLFCMGSMTFLGAFEEGLGNPPTLLYSKSVLDGFSSIALASAYGVGVLFSAVPLLIFQGGLTLGVEFLKPFLTEVYIQELSAIGGILLIGLGLSVLEIKKIKVMNLLPAIPILLVFLVVFGN